MGDLDDLEVGARFAPVRGVIVFLESGPSWRGVSLVPRLPDLRKQPAVHGLPGRKESG